MIYSMTGFGRAIGTLKSKKYTFEAKSLNSKQLDLSIRVPSKFRDLEIKMREQLAKKLERGKVDINVYVENINVECGVDGDQPVELNLNAVRSLKANIDSIANLLNIAPPADWFQIFTRFPEVTHCDKPVVEATEEELEFFEHLAGECIEKLLFFRQKEGATLELFFRAKIDRIRLLLSQIDVYEGERAAKIRERIVDGLVKLQGVDYDKSRLEQEMIFYIEKLDINEEKQRLKQHLDYFVETLSLPKPGQGKKLGFIAQEMGREINTMGSKSNHAEMQKLVVLMKDELEQIKEQVLNVM